MRAWPVAPAILLAGCGQAPDRQATPAPTTTAAAPVVAARATPAPGVLTGKVSSLRGDVSGLSARETDTALILSLAADTLFDFDRADLTPAAATNLGKVADAIRAGGTGEVTITGYTDAKGTPGYNQRLSDRRAQAVADWMATQAGVRLRHFVVRGRGAADPVAPNTRPDGSDSPEGRSRNRRVEVSIPK